MLAVLFAWACGTPSSGAEGMPAAAETGPWLDVMLPPGLEPHTVPVLHDRGAAPAVAPADERAFTALAGDRMRADLERIVDFSLRSRESAELGNGQLWGRVTGFPSGTAVVEWAAEELRSAGYDEVALQPFDQSPTSSLWIPTSWEVRILADPSFGSGTEDVVLESAMPLSDGDLPTGGVTAPLVHVGGGSPAEVERVDVRDAVAVMKSIPQGHTVFVRDPVGPRAAQLLERGAVAVLTIIDLPGNLRSRDIGCGGGACFNIGGQDGRFLESILGGAAERGLEPPSVRLSVESERFGEMSATNAVALLPGTTNPDEYVVINAHADAWFDGAGDNGDGLAVLLALARHFAEPGRRQARSLAFVVSAGHHTPGLSGPSAFLEANPEVAEGVVLVINLEHTAQRHITPARSEHADGYREWTMDAHEAPIVAGISNGAPFLDQLVREGIERYGTNFVAGPNPMASGEGGAYRRAGVPVFTTMQGPPLYHTTGEVLEMVSVPGMERMARFMAFFVQRVAEADAAEIAPAG